MEQRNKDDEITTAVVMTAYASGLILGLLVFYFIFKNMGKKTSVFLKAGAGLGASILVFFPASWAMFFFIFLVIKGDFMGKSVANTGEE